MKIKIKTPFAKIVLTITRYHVQSLLTTVTVNANTIDPDSLLPLIRLDIVNSFRSGVNNTMDIVFYTKWVDTIEH